MVDTYITEDEKTFYSLLARGLKINGIPVAIQSQGGSHFWAMGNSRRFASSFLLLD